MDGGFVAVVVLMEQRSLRLAADLSDAVTRHLV